MELIPNQVFFANYNSFYAWKSRCKYKDSEGIDMFTLVQGMLNLDRLRDIIQNFIPDNSKKSENIMPLSSILCCKATF